MIELKKIALDISLSRFIKSIWILEINKSSSFGQLYFPYGSFELIYYAKGSAEMKFLNSKKCLTQSGLFYSGQVLEPFTLEFQESVKCFGISLHPCKGLYFKGLHNSIFTGELYDIEDKIQTNLDSVEGDETAIIDLMKTYVITNLLQAEEDKMIVSIVNYISENPIQKNYQNYLENFSVSRRRIEQRFISSTGITIGQYCRKTRFHKVMKLILENTNNLNLAQLGYTAGYYDQSHFINEFKKFSGLTPHQFIITKNALIENVVGLV
ncbi:MAG TPA: helix-turn-helix domain-containing protein [Saprospiraceae bacterium]|nr:helix-turn-helix domain-containing protein [Saprospiraceae bacterium]